MAVGDVNVTIVENPTALTISTAVNAMVSALNTTMRYTVSPIGQGQNVIIVGIAQA